jgi:hypothetical protein
MEMICDACGATNQAGAEFCVQCNAYLAWDESAAGPSGAAAATSGAGSEPSAAAGPATATTTATAVVATAQDVTVPQPVVTTEGYPATWAAVGETCPTCGLVNRPELRFCAHCGYGFASSVPEQPGTPLAYAELSGPAADRAARREYRRSLPPLYRWRRVLIGVLLAALVLAGGLWVRHPVVAVRDAWYRVTKSYAPVTPVVAFVEPAGLTAPGADPAALVDRTVREWTEPWQPTGTIACGAAPGTAEIVLTFAPTRIRQLQIVPGLDKANPKRGQQLLPQEIGITYPGRRCQRALLSQGDLQQPIRADSGAAVTSVRIGINTVFPGGAGAAPLVSVTEIVLQSYPR